MSFCKYQYKNVKIPKEKRYVLNEKIIKLINYGKLKESRISNEDIFNAYTGDGGLHGLERKDFDNYHEFSEAKKEIEQGQFFTDPSICSFLIDCIKPGKHEVVGDLTSGMGNFFNYIENEKNVYGCELDIKAHKVAKQLYPEANLENMDMQYYDPGIKMDICVGNPPFNIKIGDYLSQFYYFLKAEKLLNPGGILALIVPSSFLNDEFMDKKMIEEINDLYSFVFQATLPLDAFGRLGINFPTKIMVFQKKSEHLESRKFDNQYETIESFKNGAEVLYEKFVEPALELKRKNAAKIYFEGKEKDDGFKYKVNKLLYDIKRNPKVNDNYVKGKQYVERYYKQKKPEGMEYKEWQKIRITENKVLAYLKKILKKQNIVERDEISIVKTSYGLKYKAYSRKSQIALNKKREQKYFSFVDLVKTRSDMFEGTQYGKLVKRKIAEYENQLIPFSDMEVDYVKDIDEFEVRDSNKDEILRMNPRQKNDVRKIIKKPYSIIAWQMGSGKTLCALAWGKYHLKNSHVKNIFVISSAISINLTWVERMKAYGEDYIKIEKRSDLEKIKEGQIVLVTFNMLIKQQKEIKRFMKKCSQKIALVVDESDELTNHSNKRTKATLSCFRKVRYKLLTTGTTTRNNINELYGQLELLYNNSVNMLCECNEVYKFNRKNKEIDSRVNEHYMKPFGAYYGMGLFKSCFSPSRPSVFGIGKENQNIYNADELKDIISKTIITRKFEEIVGRKIHKINTCHVQQNEAEKEIYRKIVDDFHKMNHYFADTGNSRKESMLKIIRQIQLLIKSTSIPHLFREYDSDEMPGKQKKILEMIGEFNEKVAIGTVFVDSAYDYCEKIKEIYPERPVFMIKGDVTFNKRKKIIEEFENTEDGILVSTQKSLSSSVNIPTCNRIFVESMTWNIPRIEQFYFRFIRFDSKEDKNVYFIVYEGTIEQNIMALLMAKERLNEFIKTLDFKEQSEIFEEYDINLDILKDTMSREKDSRGFTKLTWGQQKVS